MNLCFYVHGICISQPETNFNTMKKAIDDVK